MRIVEVKLGRKKRIGEANRLKNGHKIISVDPRQSDEERLDTIIHEWIHHTHPEWVGDEGEAKVAALAMELSSLLWGDNWRRITQVI